MRVLYDLNIIKNNNTVNPQYVSILSRNPDVLQSLFDATSFLNEECSIRERLYCIINNINTPVICKNIECNNHVNFIIDGRYRNNYRNFCSVKCAYNDDTIKQKKINTCQKHYNTDNPSQSLIIKNKKIATTQERFGCDYPQQSSEIRQKSVASNIKKYGTDNVMKNSEVCIKQHTIRQQSQWFINFTNQPQHKFLRSKSWLQSQHLDEKRSSGYIGDELSVSPSTVLRWLYHHNIQPVNHHCSTQQREIYDFILSIGCSDAQINVKGILGRQELDIYIPSAKVAIEFNGVFWHSCDGTNNRITKNYHLKKTEICLENNIQLIQIFENEWLYSQEIVKSRLRSILNVYETVIYARKTKIVQVEYAQSKILDDNWHMQGSAKGAFYYALQYNGEFIAHMSFSKCRYGKEYQYELLRFCCKPNTQIVGGSSKLFKHFIKQHKPTSIVTYNDRRWSNGDLYKNLHFEFKHNSVPNYFYLKLKYGQPIILHSRVNFQKHKLADKLESFDPNLTEMQNMFNNGYRVIWDCGNGVWVWNAPLST